MIDSGALIDALLDASNEAVRQGLNEIHRRAQEKAPVRDVYRHGRGSNKGVRAAGPGFARAGTFGRSQSFASPQRARAGKVIRPTTLSDLVTSRGRPHQGSNVVTNHTIRGRTNSFAPVVRSPAGLIGGEALRELQSPGHLKVARIRGKTGGTFTAESLLSGRGRYELASGRANHLDEHGNLTLGGTLRDGIKIEGPFESGFEVIGYVSAYAHDKNRTHNYAADQEFGSRHNRPHPFLRPALRESRGKIKSTGFGGIFKRAFQNAKSPSRPSEALNPIVAQTVFEFKGFEDLQRKLMRSITK